MTVFLATYAGPIPYGLPALAMHQALLGRKVDVITDFVDFSSTWDQAVKAADYGVGGWAGNVANICLGVPLAVKQNSGSPLHDMATGVYNAYFTQIAQTLVKHGFPKAYVRLGWEFNGGYYPWAAVNSPSLWIEGFQQAVKAMRAVSPDFRIVWCPALGMGQVWPETCWPGAAYVDVVGVDAYNASWGQGVLSGTNVPIEPAMWDNINTQSAGVAATIALAKKYGKPYAFPEWATGTRPDGHGGGDDPYYMAQMLPLAQGAELSGYWDYDASDFNGSFAGSPISAGQYLKTFGGAPVQALIALHAAPFTPGPLPALTCTNCHAYAVIQNGPGHFLMWVGGSAKHLTASISWSGKTINANVYDPRSMSPTTPVQGLGAAGQWSGEINPNKPFVIAIQQ